MAQKLQKDLEQQQMVVINPSASLPVGRDKLTKKGSLIVMGSPTSSLQVTKAKAAARSSSKSVRRAMMTIFIKFFFFFA